MSLAIESLLILVLILVAARLLEAFRRGGKRHPGDDSGETLIPGGEPPAPPGQPFVLPIEDFIDLHSFPPAEIVDVVDAYLQAAGNHGFQEVRLIHGKGKGVQKRRIESLLTRHPLVLEFREAPPQRGGWGATLVTLKKAPPGDPS